MLTIHEHLVPPPDFVFGGVCVVRHFSFLCRVFCFVCLRPVSCMPNDADVSGLFIVDYLFDCL